MFQNPKWKYVMNGIRWISEAPRRYIPLTLLAEFIPFPDSNLDVGDEQKPPHEDEFIARTIDLLLARHRRAYPTGTRPMPRDFHSKTHGCIAAIFQVAPDLPVEYRYGVFALGDGKSRELKAVVRFSNGVRDPGADRIPNIRGMAIKVVLPPELQQTNEDGTTIETQDFLLADFNVNLLKDAEESYYFYRAEAANRPQTYLFGNLRAFAIGWLGSIGQLTLDVFDVEYFSQTPYRLGPRQACKYLAKPSEKPARKNVSTVRPDYLREQMSTRLLDAGQNPISFDFCVQRQMHPLRQPIENAAFRWDDQESKPLKVATIVLKPDEVIAFSSPEHQWHAELLSFTPKNALREHAPLGGLNRLRVAVYEKLAELRRTANGVETLDVSKVVPMGGNLT